MGIKFQCPNGHSLNVKSFLAGKRGVCPDCGVTFRIPSESMPSTRAEPIGGSADAVPEAVAARESAAVPHAAVAPGSPSNGHVGRPYQPASMVPVPAAPVAASPAYAPQPALPSGVPIPAAGAIPAARPAAPGVVPVGVPVGTPAPYGQPAALPAWCDPISESPHAIWYIRPPSGGQYGPARGDVMRNWLAEGRVSGDSLVWREGWTDWRSAGQVFPQLAGGPQHAAGPMPAAAAVPSAAVPSAAQASTAASSPADAAPRSTRTTARYSARKKSGSGLAIAALVGLVVVCVVLVGVLVVVLNR
jgi:hypothetical protein